MAESVRLVGVKEIPKPAQKRRGGKRGINPKTVPAWARELADTVCSDFNLDPVPIRWRKRRPYTVSGVRIVGDGTERFRETRIDRSSSGRYFKGKDCHIIVTAGVDEADQKLVLLHELAHHMSPPKHNHTFEFWENAWTLYSRYFEDLEYAYNREANYREKSVEMAPITVKMAYKLDIGKYTWHDVIETEILGEG